MPTVEVADGPPSNTFEHKRLSNCKSASQMLPPSQVGSENNLGSTFVRDWGTVQVPARHGKKTAIVTESPQYPVIPPPKLEIPTVSRVKEDMSDEDDLAVPQPPKLNISAGNRVNISAVSRMNREMSQNSPFPKPVPSHKTGTPGGIPQIPNQGSLPSSESLYDLTLLDHFKKCQHKYQRSVWVGYDMMSTWQMVHHNEATLRNLCREKQPTSQNELKLLLMQELGGIEGLPNNHSVTELIAETADYFIP